MRGYILIHDANALCWRQFSQPTTIFETWDVGEIRPILRQIDHLVNNQQLTAVGFLSYEAASAFDPALTTNPPNNVPLLWFGLYENSQIVTLSEIAAAQESDSSPSNSLSPKNPHPSLRDTFPLGKKEPRHASLASPLPEGEGSGVFPIPQTYTIGTWQPSLHEEAFVTNIAKIKAHIAAGETYQVNYTFRLNSTFSGDPLAYFLDLQAAQNGLYGAYIDGGQWAICSASPELFFTLDGEKLESRPMKGTAARGLSWQEDVTQIDWLHRSEKNRAENVMIVDMIRNDMGRIAKMGSVHVPSLFDVSRYPTVLQMTSTVRADTTASIDEILAALFPCASITGAPKVRTMEIIRDLEETPRGIYCGAIGFLAPQRQAQFSVAIRTVTVDRENGKAEYGTGGGIVWDSQALEEYHECRLKAQVLTTRRPPFCIIESLLFAPDKGLWLLDEHLARLQNSAGYFDYPVHVDGLKDELISLFADEREPMKVRVLLGRDGNVQIEADPLIPKSKVARLGLAKSPIQSGNPFLYHKTTVREMYTLAETESADATDILLWNERDEITETTTANVVFRINGEWVTPPVSSGLLAGTYRDYLLKQGNLREQIMPVSALGDVDAIAVINSVRGWRKAELVS